MIHVLLCGVNNFQGSMPNMWIEYEKKRVCWMFLLKQLINGDEKC